MWCWRPSQCSQARKINVWHKNWKTIAETVIIHELHDYVTRKLKESKYKWLALVGEFSKVVYKFSYAYKKINISIHLRQK